MRRALDFAERREENDQRDLGVMDTSSLSRRERYLQSRLVRCMRRVEDELWPDAGSCEDG